MVTRRKSKTTTPRMLGWKRSKVDKKDESVEEKEEKEAEEEEAWKDDEDGEELEAENNAAMAPEEGRGRGRERGASPVRPMRRTQIAPTAVMCFKWARSMSAQTTRQVAAAR